MPLLQIEQAAQALTDRSASLTPHKAKSHTPTPTPTLTPISWKLLLTCSVTFKRFVFLTFCKARNKCAQHAV
jgi:hypothetical protein